MSEGVFWGESVCHRSGWAALYKYHTALDIKHETKNLTTEQRGRSTMANHKGKCLCAVHLLECMICVKNESMSDLTLICVTL